MEAYDADFDLFDTVVRKLAERPKQAQRQERDLYILPLTQRRDPTHRTTVRLYLVVLIAHLEEEVELSGRRCPRFHCI
jgi:hypothetical protein